MRADVYLAWNNVHDPNEAPETYIQKHATIRNEGRRNLAAMVSALDDSLTAVVDMFKAKGMWEHTLFVLTTDNGGNLGGSGINYPLRSAHQRHQRHLCTNVHAVWVGGWGE